MKTWTLEGALKDVPAARSTPTGLVRGIEGLRLPPRPWQLKEILEQHSVSPTGVVHLGAHYGQELETYLACGFQHILYAEANPHVFPVLEERIQFWNGWLEAFQQAYQLKRPWVRAVHRAVGPTDGEVRLHRTEYDMQASILAPAEATMHEIEQLTVPGSRLDTLISDQGLGFECFSFLHMDIQGAELLAMESAPNLMKHLKMVLTEINYEARYHGCPTPEQLDTFLEGHGFRRVLRTGPFPDYPVGDALYVR